MDLFDKVKTAYSSLESNSSWPGDDGKMGKVAATECRGPEWPVLVSSMYYPSKSRKFCMFHHHFSLSWFFDILKLLHVKEKV